MKMRTVLWGLFFAVSILPSCPSSSPTVPGGDAAFEEAAPDPCESICEGTACGEIEGCACGACKEGEECGENHRCVAVVVPPACAELCSASGLQCGNGPDGCDCGVCTGGQICTGQGKCVASACETECEGLQCGGTANCWCGDCPADFECIDHVCGICTPQCVDEGGWPFECGPDGCGGQCGDCPENSPGCLDHMCVIDDPCLDLCVGYGYECDWVWSEDETECYCGSCEDKWECQEGMCVPVGPNCDNVCKNAQCGKIGDCKCGQCPAGYKCSSDHVCEKQGCTPKCSDPATGQAFECGPDGCGGVCGECLYGECSANKKCVCQPKCIGSQCGPDGCGGACGQCPPYYVCAWDGQCYNDCTPAEVQFSPVVQKWNYMAVGQGGHPGEAVDVDLDVTTCAPMGDCEDGYDNEMSGIFSQMSQFVDVDAELAKMLEDAQLVPLLEMVGYVENGSNFVLNFFLGDPVSEKWSCDYMLDDCSYWVDSASINLATCQPYVTFDNAKVVNGQLKAGGLGYQIKMLLPLMPGFPMLFPIHHARIVATVSNNPWNGGMTLSGIIGGAIPKQDLLDAVDLLPDDGLPVSKEMIKNLLDMFIQPDIDADGDGELDSASVAFKFGSIPGTIIGVY